jgi:cell division transport system permease protein
LNSSVFNQIKTGIGNLLSNKQVGMVTIATMTVAFSILGLFLVVFVNLDSLLTHWSRQVQLVVYLQDDITESQRTHLATMISAVPEVAGSRLVSRESAWENFKKAFSADMEFLESLKVNPLPASFNISFKSVPDRVDVIRRYAEEFRKHPGVESVEYGEKWISRFDNFMVFLRIFLIAVGGFLCLGLVFIVANTIKLSLYSRQEEIELMLLIGATRSYIKLPFLLEGMLQGVVSALLAEVLVKAVHLYMKYQFQDSIQVFARGADFQFIPPEYLLMMVGLASLVGLIGSYYAVSRFLLQGSAR